jgi:E3 ubiquitin-protein ligase synoviolin
MILLANLWSITVKYSMNVYDNRNEGRWQHKSLYVFYVDLITDFIKLFSYLTFFLLILTFYGLPLNILREVWITARSFLLKVRDLRRLRAATRNMDQMYPNLGYEEWERLEDKTCIICREEMVVERPGGENAGNGNANGSGNNARDGHQDNAPKKLSCGHIFHFHCLRSWLERQQSCPTW